MKKLATIGLALIAAIAFSSCAKFNAPELNKTRKVALVSVISADEINASEVRSGGLVGLVGEIAQSDKLSMKPHMTRIKKEVLQNASKMFGFKILPESSVLNNKAYKSVKENSLGKSMGNFITPSGYKFIPSGQTADIINIIKGTRADAAMVVKLSAKLEKRGNSMGNVMVGTHTNLSIEVINKKGETILFKPVAAVSKNTTRQLAGVYDATDIANFLKENVKSCIKQIADYVKEEKAAAAKGK